MSTKLSGPWDEQQIADFLQAETFPMRLACLGDDGFPRVVSVWYGYEEGEFRCVSHQSSLLVKLLQKNDRVGFEVAPNEPPYRGVRGQGIAQLDSDSEGVVLKQMLQRYLGGTDSKLGQWLLSRVEGEMLITIKPQRLFSWDYQERMAQ